jgi:hypothetical protein
MKEFGGSQRNEGKIFSLLRLTRIGRRMFWCIGASVSCNNLSVVATCEHTDSASSPTYHQLMGAGRKWGEPGKRSPDIPGPSVLEDPGAGNASPEAAHPGTPAPTPRTTKSRSELSASSLSWGPAPTTFWSAVPCNAPPALGTSDIDTIIVKLGDVTGHAIDRQITETNEA